MHSASTLSILCMSTCTLFSPWKYDTSCVHLEYPMSTGYTLNIPCLLRPSWIPNVHLARQMHPMSNVLRPPGVFLVHSITLNAPCPQWPY
jgi:hypothetical protein